MRAIHTRDILIIKSKIKSNKTLGGSQKMA